MSADAVDYKLYNPKCLLCNKRMIKFCKRRYLSFTCKKCLQPHKKNILDIRFKFQVKFITNSKNKSRKLFSIVRRINNYKLIYNKKLNNASLFKYNKQQIPYFITDLPNKLFKKFILMQENDLIREINKHLLFI